MVLWLTGTHGQATPAAFYNLQAGSHEKETGW